MPDPVHILSLGAGVQSSTLALMAAAGEITPMPVAAIFADTQAEPKAVYEWLDWLEKRLPFPVIRATAGSLEEESLKLRVSKSSGNHYVKSLIPAYVLRPTGKKGLLGRRCTADFKVRVILREGRSLRKAQISEWSKDHAADLGVFRKWERTVAEAKRTGSPVPMKPLDVWQRLQASAPVIQWVGISIDEAHRMKESRVPWARVEWPLIDARMSRDGCKEWMQAHGYPEPPRSACCFCPFHGDEEWIRLRDESPEDFARAVRFERALQAANKLNTGTAIMRGEVFLHTSCVPLDQVKFETVPQHAQLSLFGNECEGLCGV